MASDDSGHDQAEAMKPTEVQLGTIEKTLLLPIPRSKRERGDD